MFSCFQIAKASTKIADNTIFKLDITRETVTSIPPEEAYEEITPVADEEAPNMTNP